MTVEPSDPAALVFVDGVQALCATQLKHGSRLVSFLYRARTCHETHAQVDQLYYTQCSITQ
jgi:hypothetical protein